MDGRGGTSLSLERERTCKVELQSPHAWPYNWSILVKDKILEPWNGNLWWFLVNDVHYF